MSAPLPLSTLFALAACPIALTSLYPSRACAQKVEREYGIDRDEVPAPVFGYLDTAFAAERRRERFYRDESEDVDAIEAKFKSDGSWYSVEFSLDGEWLDTEVEIPVQEVPAEVWNEVCAEWAERFSRYRVERVQLHRGRGGARFYEVEVNTRRDFEWDRYEFTIDPNGAVLDEQLVKLAPGHLDRW